MALEGTLKDFSLADIYQLIGLQRKTGVLTLKGKDDTVTVTFLDGKVVGADSLNRRLESRLGNVLIKTGTLTQEQLARALEIQKETLQRLGFILTHHQIISSESLRNAIQMQILQIIYRLFRWKDGEYHFSQETTIEYDRENVVPISAESILMEGARMIDEWPIIERRIRSYDMIFQKKQISQEIVVVGAEDADEVDFDDTIVRKKKAKTDPDKIRISEEEKRVYDLVDGKLKVGEIIERSRSSEFDTAKSLHELLTRDVIEEVRERSGATVSAPTAVVDEIGPVEAAVVPLPLVLLLVALAIASLLTSASNPLNRLDFFGPRSNPVGATKKAVSFQRIEAIGRAIESYTLSNGKGPAKLRDLVPSYLAANLLHDPWGYPYVYRQRPDKYWVIGRGHDGRTDPDLFLSRSVDAVALAPTRSVKGGVTLIE
ncbi:MAG TPA: DUF4388 domain-containing protein [Thermoanaerobaculia bacterium]|nr:DUF4388 domain-containing protein [Thermoanaerobaculia bacterium]